MPFRSKAQWRMFFSNPKLRKYAKKWEDKSPGYKSLPARIGRKGKRKRKS